MSCPRRDRPHRADRLTQRASGRGDRPRFDPPRPEPGNVEATSSQKGEGPMQVAQSAPPTKARLIWRWSGLATVSDVELATLVVSVLVLVCAVGAVWYARRQTTTQEATHREQQQPSFVPEIVNAGDDRGYRLCVRLTTDGVTGLVVTIKDQGLSFPDESNGRDPVYRRASWGPLQTGERACWRLEITDAAPPHFWLRVSSRGNGSRERWETAIMIELPPRPRVRFM